MTGALVNTSTIEAQGGIRTAASGDYVKIKVLSIGDWNMDTTPTLNVAHGLTYANIISVTGYITDDASAARYTIPYVDATGIQLEAQVIGTNIYLARGTTFDNNTFDATSFNRGIITIIYTA